MNGAGFSGLLLDDPAAGVFRYARTALTSPDIFAREHEAIFSKVWLYLGHESEIRRPGDYVRRTVAGRPLIFARNKTGEVRALYNTCTHRGATICRQDAGNAKAFQCFYHAWTFDLDGALIGVPDEQSYGPGFDRSEMGLKPVAKCESYRGFVFVCFDPYACSLIAYLAGVTDYLDLIVDSAEGEMEIVLGSNQYTIRANWKLLAENSYDGYHALPTHETYFKYVASMEADARKKMGEIDPTAAGESFTATGEAIALGNGHAVTQKIAPWGRPIARWSPLFGAETRDEVAEVRRRLVARYGEERARLMADMSRNMVIFPNLVVNDIMAVTVRTWDPLQVDEMRVTAWHLAPTRESARMREARLDNFLTFLGPGGFATPDDVEALESCQQGFAADGVTHSDISRGVGCATQRPVDESQMRGYWRRWRDLVEGRVEVPA
ncbi:MAG: p-cumate dioxygenase [Candidatus Eremiobacteraeota bacterium]|nr:p-cumate dioxygenase [Candidatus Eremiobacteraeota bacterium]